MSDPQQLKEAIEEVVTAAIDPLIERLDAQERRVRKFNAQRNLALLCAAACLVAASFSVGYAWNSRVQLRDQLDTNTRALCSSARSTALAFRSRQVTESARGDRRREGTRHYLERLVGQRESLRAAAGLECPSLQGFATFPYLRGKALNEIESILFQLAPKRFKPPRLHTAVEPTAAGDNAGRGNAAGDQVAGAPAEVEADPGVGAGVGGGGQQTPSQGHQQQPSSHGGGQPGGDGQPTTEPAQPQPASGGQGGSASATATSEAPASDAPGSSEEGHEAAGGNPGGEGVGHVVEDVGETVQGLGDSVGNTVEGVGDGLRCGLSPDC